jgi:hypothetical protein
MELVEVKGLIAELTPIAKESPGTLLVVGLVALAVVVSAIVKLVEIVAKCSEFISKSVRNILDHVNGGQEKRQAIRRRAQFLRVIGADLASIGKAEAWNDQHYTDLEAEVQVDGRFYAGFLDRLLRRKSAGLRQAPSLMKAIEGSTERRLLLTGDPGSGKSVALRHLAMQMAEVSLRSKAVVCPIPLYVNLRDLVVPAEKICADSIREFVIDNIRRGDADTAEYLKENWSYYRDQGSWFFLFDSFDEIPAVMHAAAGDPAVGNYGQAVQQFMDGLGDCRGVLASREFKSPILHWPKLRILQLDESKQLELIDRTFLPEQKKSIAKAAVSVSSSATYRNPLFLTLLCNFVKKNGVAPQNEHELLIDHVSQLAQRDREYVFKIWGLKPADLMGLASELALLLGDAPELGLSPTIDEILSVAASVDFSRRGEDLIKVIEALTYIKIGRTDVQSSDRSIRRFAFSHRRYQEGLYARRLSDRYRAEDLASLLVDVRRREYLVALLQIGSREAIEAVVSVGEKFLTAASANIKLKHRRFLGVDLYTYGWKDDQLSHVLSVFREAKRYAPEGPWAPLQQPAERLLADIWSNGDVYDALKVVEYCAVGSEEALASRLDFSINSGIDRLEELAVDSCKFLAEPKESFSAWVRVHVCARILAAPKLLERLRWEAVGSDLPPQYLMDVPVKRVKSIFAAPVGVRAMYAAYLVVAREVMKSRGKSAASARKTSHRNLLMRVRLSIIHSVYFISLLIMMMAQLHSEIKFSSVPLVVMALVACGLLGYSLSYIIRVSCLDEPCKLTVGAVVSRWRKIRVSRFAIIGFLLSGVVFFLPGLLIWVISGKLGWFLETKMSDVVIIGSAAFFAVVGFSIISTELIWSAKARKRAIEALAQEKSLQRAMSKSKKSSELVALSSVVLSRGAEVEDIRAAITYVSAARKILLAGRAAKEPEWLQGASTSDVRAVLSNLLRAMEVGQRRSDAAPI